MKYGIVIVLFFLLIGCDQVSKEVETAFDTIAKKQDSISKMEYTKIDVLYDSLQQLELSISDREKTVQVYKGVQHFKASIDSLMVTRKTRSENANKEVLVEKYNASVLSLERVFDSLKGYKVTMRLDTFYQTEKDLKKFPEEAFNATVYSGKLDGAKKAELFMQAIQKKYEPKSVIP
ncbi:hypothetical protein SAMN05216480_101510 [Pustulibacterium marinum]|uniref:Uncharacterized protein n=1 Tax=Pustulibacterium marinum TaxID=1224947 RepID=A0A1I7F0T0_9FLAO|nr:hypothetical protein [Pustulibacterium marinum]SFU29744.1 hypothetical protein SAMN05216480_101510 [Pustulibacterium marinum]